MTAAALPARYRIRAAEAHSFSTLLVEDEQGANFLLAVATGLLTPVDAMEAESLLDTRAYRAWRGDRTWAPLERLPVAVGGAAMSPPPTFAGDEQQPGG